MHAGGQEFDPPWLHQSAVKWVGRVWDGYSEVKPINKPGKVGLSTVIGHKNRKLEKQSISKVKRQQLYTVS